MTAERTRIQIAAAELREGDRFDKAGRSRVELTHPLPGTGELAVRVAHPGSKLRSLRTYRPDDQVTVWRQL